MAGPVRVLIVLVDDDQLPYVEVAGDAGEISEPVLADRILAAMAGWHSEVQRRAAGGPPVHPEEEGPRGSVPAAYHHGADLVAGLARAERRSTGPGMPVLVRVERLEWLIGRLTQRAVAAGRLETTGAQQ